MKSVSLQPEFRVTTFVILFVIANVAQADELRCLVTFLRAYRFPEQVLDSVDDYKGTRTSCRLIVRETLEMLTNERFSIWEKDDPRIKCYNELDDLRILSLKIRAMDLVDFGVLLFKKTNLMTRRAELRAEQKRVVAANKEKCEAFSAQERYGNDFDNALVKRSELYINEENEYCIDKDLIIKRLIDKQVYNLNNDLKSVLGIRCDQVLRNIFDNFMDDMRKITTGCVVEARKKYGYFDYILKLELFSTLVLTVDQKITERQSYIDAMYDIEKQVIKRCPKDFN